ncbi:questin oxidase family protein [Streptomyces winkii]|uniref:questin oxidase family protein n=1 Tax=Streptomyces winkii TaxID=3051178 RepID=UPI0028D41436|nr:questin oxidase family protein [Streptomyces sp. DSM 40971]
MDTHGTDSSGTLDEALERLHSSGPERNDWLSNHAPMAVEALVRHGKAPAVHAWIDRYRDKLEEMPSPSSRVTDADWQEALGDPRRLADWIAYFTRQLEERPWREVLAEWWPRMLPGISAAATHGVIRVGHSVRTLLDEEPPAAGRPSDSPRVAELAHALGYWAGRYSTLPGVSSLPAAASPEAGLADVPRVSDQSGGIRERLARITALPARPGTDGAHPADVRAELSGLVRAATHRYATHAHGSPVMLVHAATAPNAVLRTLPALPERLWLPSLDAAWSAATAVTAAYAPAAAVPAPLAAASRLTAEEVFERAAAHGDEHTIKLTDTALDVAAGNGNGDGEGKGDGEGEDGPYALAAALRAAELIDPAGA